MPISEKERLFGNDLEAFLVSPEGIEILDYLRETDDHIPLCVEPIVEADGEWSLGVCGFGFIRFNEEKTRPISPWQFAEYWLTIAAKGSEDPQEVINLIKLRYEGLISGSLRQPRLISPMLIFTVVVIVAVGVSIFLHARHLIP